MRQYSTGRVICCNFLLEGGQLEISSECSNCRGIVFIVTPIVHSAKMEHKLNPSGQADVAGFDSNGEIVFLVEILHTHSTHAMSRENYTWYEFQADDIVREVGLDKSTLTWKVQNCRDDFICDRKECIDNYQQIITSVEDSTKCKRKNPFTHDDIEFDAESSGEDSPQLYREPTVNPTIIPMVYQDPIITPKVVQEVQIPKITPKVQVVQKVLITPQLPSLPMRKLAVELGYATAGHTTEWCRYPPNVMNLSLSKHWEEFLNKKKCMMCEKTHGTSKYYPFCGNCYDNVWNK